MSATSGMEDVPRSLGHGMWGLAHGPATGRLLAEQITTGKQPEVLRPFDPRRRGPRAADPPAGN